MKPFLRSRRGREVAIDVALTLFVLWASLAQWGSQGFDELRDVSREPDGLGFLLVLVATLPLLARRSTPLGVLLLTSAAGVGLLASDYVFTVPLAPAVALFTIAAARPPSDPRVPYAVGIAAAAWIAGLALQNTQLEAHAGPPTVTALIWIGAWLAGDRMRESRGRAIAQRERTVAEERTHIARELHDSAGHAINVILVQAGAARVLAERDPEGSRQALATVEAVARETLGEIDHLVGALREDDGRGASPLPGLDALDALMQRHRAAGLAVNTDLRGSRGTLGGAADRAAYRIVQESLTNAARHGRGSATVAIDFRPDRLDLTVTNPVDPGAGSPSDGGGRGIVGMRERAALLGGSLEAERGSDATFVVRASLPYAAEPAA